MTTEFAKLLKDNGYTQFSFSEWYYNRAIPCRITYGEKYYMVYKEKLTAFKIVECTYVGKERNSDGKYLNSNGQYNQWVLHLVIAGVGHTIATLSDMARKEIFLSVANYETYVKTQNKAYCVELAKNEQTYYLTEYFYRIWGYKNTDRGVWNKTLVGYTAKKGDLKTDKVAVVIDYLLIDADGIHTHTSHKSENGRDCFSTEVKALENARVSEVVDFDGFEDTEKVVEVEININIKATTRDNALEQINAVLEKKFT